MASELDKDRSEMKEEVKHMKKQVEEETGAWKQLQQQESQGGRKDKGQGDVAVESMKGFKTKDVPKPEPFDMAPEDFEESHELFKAQLISQDNKWSDVLEWMAEAIKGKWKRKMEMK